MAIRFYLEIGGKRYTLPVNPASIKMDIPSNNQSNEVIKLGEITQLAVNDLKTLSFDSIFPSKQGASYVLKNSTFRQPKNYVKLIEDAMNSLKPIRIIVTDTNINMLASIDSFSWSIEDATNDYKYSLTLKEYKKYSARLLKSKTTTTGKKKQKKPTKRPVSTSTKITRGTRVRVNGRLYADSTGRNPGIVERNAERVVSIILNNPKSNQKYPIHVSTLNGGARGWVSRGAVKKI